MKSWILVDRMQNNRDFTLSRTSLTLRDLRRSCARGICSLRSHIPYAPAGSLQVERPELKLRNNPSLSGICAGATLEGFAPCGRTSLALPRGPCNKEGKKLKLRFYMYIGPLESKLSRPYIHIKTG